MTPDQLQARRQLEDSILDLAMLVQLGMGDEVTHVQPWAHLAARISDNLRQRYEALCAADLAARTAAQVSA